MLTQAEQSMKGNEWIVFLGWTPHPVMGAMKIAYLDGMGDSGFGAATVHTNVRKGYMAECPNVGNFIKNLKFDLVMENDDDGRDPEGRRRQHGGHRMAEGNPDAATPWLDGVTTFDGGDAAAAVKAALGRLSGRLPKSTDRYEGQPEGLPFFISCDKMTSSRDGGTTEGKDGSDFEIPGQPTRSRSAPGARRSSPSSPTISMSSSAAFPAA